MAHHSQKVTCFAGANPLLRTRQMSERLQPYKEQTCCHEKPESRLMERMLDPDLTLSLVQEL